MRFPWTVRRSNQSVLKEIKPEYSLEGLRLKLQLFDNLMGRANSFEKTLMVGTIKTQQEKGAAEDEMTGHYHRLNGHEFEQTLGDSEAQGSLVCCSPWGHRVRYDLATEEQQQSPLVTISLFSTSVILFPFCK